MSVNTSFTLCPSSSDFVAQPSANDCKRPVRSLQPPHVNAPVQEQQSNDSTTVATAGEGMQQKQMSRSSSRLIRGTFRNRRKRSPPSQGLSTSHTTSSRSSSSGSSTKYAKPFEPLVNDRKMSQGPISPLPQAEFLAWKKQQQKQMPRSNQQQQEQAGEYNSNNRNNNDVVNWEVCPTQIADSGNSNEECDSEQSAVREKQKLPQVQARQPVLTERNTTTSGDKANYPALKAVRVTPFEPLVHQRNLQGGRLLVGYSVTERTGEGDNNTDTTTSSWKRRYQKAELARLESRQKVIRVLDEQRQLKIQVIQHRASQLASAPQALDVSQQEDFLEVSNLRKRSSPSMEHDGPTQRREQKIIVESKHMEVLDTSNVVPAARKASNDTTITEDDDDDDDEEKVSFINVRRGGRGDKRVSSSQESFDLLVLAGNDDEGPSNCDAKKENTGNDNSNGENNFQEDEEANNTKEERDDNALLGCWNQADTSDATDNSSHRGRRLSFTAASIEENKKPPRLDKSSESHSQSAKSSNDSTPGSLRFDACSASKNPREFVFKGGDNSLSALDVSAITATSSPTPVKCDHLDNVPASGEQDGGDDTMPFDEKEEQNETDDNVPVHQSPIPVDDVSPEKTVDLEETTEEKPKATKRGKNARRKRTPMKPILRRPSANSSESSRLTRSRVNKTMCSTDSELFDETKSQHDTHSRRQSRSSIDKADTLSVIKTADDERNALEICDENSEPNTGISNHGGTLDPLETSTGVKGNNKAADQPRGEKRRARRLRGTLAASLQVAPALKKNKRLRR